MATTEMTKTPTEVLALAASGAHDAFEQQYGRLLDPSSESDAVFVAGWNAALLSQPSPEGWKLVGAKMANVCFNLSQQQGRELSENACAGLKKLQVEWDAFSAPSHHLISRIEP